MLATFSVPRPQHVCLSAPPNVGCRGQKNPYCPVQADEHATVDLDDHVAEADVDPDHMGDGDVEMIDHEDVFPMHHGNEDLTADPHVDADRDLDMVPTDGGDGDPNADGDDDAECLEGTMDGHTGPEVMSDASFLTMEEEDDNVFPPDNVSPPPPLSLPPSLPPSQLQKRSLGSWFVHHVTCSGTPMETQTCGHTEPCTWVTSPPRGGAESSAGRH